MLLIIPKDLHLEFLFVHTPKKFVDSKLKLLLLSFVSSATLFHPCFNVSYIIFSSFKCIIQFKTSCGMIIYVFERLIVVIHPDRPSLFVVWYLVSLFECVCMLICMCVVAVIHRPLGSNLPTLTAVFVKMRLRIRYKIGDVFMLVDIKMLVSLSTCHDLLALTNDDTYVAFL